MSLGIYLASVEKLRHRKTDNKKQATCFAALLQKELNIGVARFTTHINLSCNKSGCWQVWTSLVKHTTPLFNSFCRNVAKQVARFRLDYEQSLFSVVRRAKRETRKWPGASALVSRVSQLRRSRARALLFRCPFYRSFRWHCRQNNSLSSEKVEWKVLSIGYRFIQWMVLSIFCTTEAWKIIFFTRFEHCNFHLKPVYSMSCLF